MTFAEAMTPEKQTGMSPFGILLIAFALLALLLFIAALILRKKGSRLALMVMIASLGVAALSSIWLGLWINSFQIEYKVYLGWGMGMFWLSYISLLAAVYFKNVKYVGMALFILFFLSAVAGLGLSFGYGRASLENEVSTVISLALLG